MATQKIFFFSLFLLGTMFAYSTELSPWFGKPAELEFRNKYTFQTYKKLKTIHKIANSHARDHFDTLSLGSSLELIGVASELEVTFADTKYRSFGIDNFRLTGRYLWTNDVLGMDPLSLVTGLTLTQAFTSSLYDISSFHHGRFELEWHTAIGKEFSFKEFWFSRLWCLGGIGIGDQGAPWLRFNVTWQQNCLDVNQFTVYMNTLWGCGNQSLNPHHFRGYGLVRHQSIDLGLSYSRFFESVGGTFSLNYTRRVYALNFPEQANLITLEFFYPFGLTSGIGY